MSLKRLDIFPKERLQPELQEIFIDTNKLSYGLVISNYRKDKNIFLSFFKTILSKDKKIKFLFFIFDGIKFLYNNEIISILNLLSQSINIYISLESLDKELIENLNLGKVVDFSFFLDILDKEKVYII